MALQDKFEDVSQYFSPIHYQAIAARKQRRAAKRLREDGPQDPTPLPYIQAQIAAENLANSGRIAGHDAALEDINTGISASLGEAKKASTSSSDTQSFLSKLNNNATSARRKLIFAGQEAKERRMREAREMEVGRANWIEKGRQENNQAIGSLEGAASQNEFGAVNAGFNMAMMAAGAPSMGGGQSGGFATGQPPQNTTTTTYTDANNFVGPPPQEAPIHQFGSSNMASYPPTSTRKRLGPYYTGQPDSGPYPTPDGQAPQYPVTNYEQLYKRRYPDYAEY